MRDLLETPIVVLHVTTCVFLILIILIQPGRSGGMGALAGGAAQQVFGGRGAGNLLTKITWVTGSIFFLTSVTLAYLASSEDDSLIKRARSQSSSQQAPALTPTPESEPAPKP
jgi:preprotein translocase subunit SecG